MNNQKFSKIISPSSFGLLTASWTYINRHEETFFRGEDCIEEVVIENLKGIIPVINPYFSIPPLHNSLRELPSSLRKRGEGKFKIRKALHSASAKAMADLREESAIYNIQYTKYYYGQLSSKLVKTITKFQRSIVNSVWYTILRKKSRANGPILAKLSQKNGLKVADFGIASSFLLLAMTLSEKGVKQIS